MFTATTIYKQSIVINSSLLFIGIVKVFIFILIVFSSSMLSSEIAHVL